MTDLKLTSNNDAQEKQSYIYRLLDRGIYKIKNKQLYECSLEELEDLLRRPII
ncbi:Fur-regulated basic protein FbpA [Pseudalkalibacillus hwajinpoensis]|uniref:Fur-regulated basic protein FbpA n=1 Tax=Guptibacillus hwajinpoensis TaxID=208199 RepID=UPI00325BD6B8